MLNQWKSCKKAVDGTAFILFLVSKQQDKGRVNLIIPSQTNIASIDTRIIGYT